MKTLQRIAKKQGIEIDDLLDELKDARELPGIKS